MKCNGRISLALAITATLFRAAAGPNAAAQQVTGTPGSPSATTSIDGKQIPPPPPKFGGIVVNSYSTGCYNCGGWAVAGAVVAGAAAGVAVANANASAANANTAAAIANAAAANANAAAAAANQNYTMGEIVGAIPAGCAVPVVNGTTYYPCGDTWFTASYDANGVYYRVVPTP